MATSVVRAVDSGIKGPQFESSHRQILYLHTVNCMEKSESVDRDYKDYLGETTLACDSNDRKLIFEPTSQMLLTKNWNGNFGKIVTCVWQSGPLLVCCTPGQAQPRLGCPSPEPRLASSRSSPCTPNLRPALVIQIRETHVLTMIE